MRQCSFPSAFRGVSISARTPLALLGLSAWLAGAAPASAQCPPLQEIQSLLAPDGVARDHFGVSTSIWATTSISGAYKTNDNGSNSGAAYVFERGQGSPGVWAGVRKLFASDGAAGDAFGWSTGIHGDLAVVGAYLDDDIGIDSGSVYVFERHLGGVQAWGERANLLALDGGPNDGFGYSVAIHGDTIVVGACFDAPQGGNSGSAYVFERHRGGAENWGQAAKLVAPGGAAGDRFGWSVSIDGDTIVVAAPFDDDHGTSSGSVHVFERDNGGPGLWSHSAKLLAFDGAPMDRFGGSVAVRGDTLAVGAPLDDDNGANSGSVYVFTRDSVLPDTWNPVTKSLASDGTAGDNLGFSVAVDGDRVLAGALFQDGQGNNSGAAYVFERHQGGIDQWGQRLRLSPAGAAGDSHFGRSVSLWGTLAAVGADKFDSAGVDSGATFLFDDDPRPTAYCVAGVTSSGCQASMGASGTASLSNGAPFLLTCTGVEGKKSGIFFYSNSGRNNVAWGNSNSFRCVKAPLLRMNPPLSSGGTAGTCTGSFSTDWNAFVAANPTKGINQALVAGMRIQAQAWFRDPAAGTGPVGAKGTALSNGIEFLVCP